MIKLTKTQKLARLAINVAIAFGLHALDSLLSAPIALPGIRLGLSNLVTIILLYSDTPRSAFAVCITRIFLTNILFGSFVSFLYSFAGSMLSFIVMLLLKNVFFTSRVWITAVFGSIVHGIGQILAGMVIMKSTAILWYLLPLTAAGILTGAVIGIVSSSFLQHFSKISQKNRKNP